MKLRIHQEQADADRFVLVRLLEQHNAKSFPAMKKKIHDEAHRREVSGELIRATEKIPDIPHRMSHEVGITLEENEASLKFLRAWVEFLNQQADYPVVRLIDVESLGKKQSRLKSFVRDLILPSAEALVDDELKERLGAPEKRGRRKRHCSNCGHLLEGRYCSDCGNKAA